MVRLTKLNLFAIGFLFLSALVLTLAMWWNMDHLPSDPFTFGSLVAFTLGVWFPLGLYVWDLVHDVEGWVHNDGTYEKYVWYNNDTLRVFISRRPRTRKAYRIAILADDTDYFGDECSTVVWEYDDYDSLYNVLATAEIRAVELLVANYEADSPF